MTGAAFDALAARYDELWTATAAGLRQREAVWRRIDGLFREGDSVLDLGCGTGEDALHLAAAGARVTAIDASREMVRVARSRGVNAFRLPIERAGELGGPFDGALSNFGAFNCVADPGAAAASLAPLIRRGGYFALCVIGPCCAWEICHYLRRLDFGRAFRRWKPGGCSSSLGVHVRYPTVRGLVRALRGTFELVRWYGIGVFVPPSYVGTRSAARVAALDARAAGWPVVRTIADHRLLIFKRL